MKYKTYDEGLNIEPFKKNKTKEEEKPYITELIFNEDTGKIEEEKTLVEDIIENEGQISIDQQLSKAKFYNVSMAMREEQGGKTANLYEDNHIKEYQKEQAELTAQEQAILAKYLAQAQKQEQEGVEKNENK